jgi:hypothetical protein
MRAGWAALGVRPEWLKLGGITSGRHEKRMDYCCEGRSLCGPVQHCVSVRFWWTVCVVMLVLFQSECRVCQRR